MDVYQKLEPNQSLVTYKNSKIILAGYNEVSLINSIFSFMGNIVMKHDKRIDGSAYLYYPTELELEDSWSHIAPSIPGAILDTATQDSNFMFNITFKDVDSAEFANYLDLLKSLKFIVSNNKNDTTDIYSVNATYNYIDTSVSIDATLDMKYNKAENTLSMTLIYTLVNL